MAYNLLQGALCAALFENSKSVRNCMETWEGLRPVRWERIAPDAGRHKSGSSEPGTWRRYPRGKSEFDETNPNSKPKPVICQGFSGEGRGSEAAKQTQSRRLSFP